MPNPTITKPPPWNDETTIESIQMGLPIPKIRSENHRSKRTAEDYRSEKTTPMPNQSTPSTTGTGTFYPEGNISISEVLNEQTQTNDMHNDNNSLSVSPINADNINLSDASDSMIIHDLTNESNETIIPTSPQPPQMDLLGDQDPPGFTTDEEDPISLTMDDIDQSMQTEYPVYYGNNNNKESPTNMLIDQKTIAIEEIIQEDLENPRNENMPTVRISSGLHVSSLAIDKISAMGLETRYKSDIISDPDFQLKKFIKIKDIVSLESRIKEVIPAATQLRKRVQKCKIDRAKWLSAVHYCSNQGEIALQALIRDSNLYTGNIKNEGKKSGDEKESIENGYLKELQTDLTKLSLFTKIRGLSQSFSCSVRIYSIIFCLLRDP